MKKFTATHRLLHWSLALAFIVLFITGFLRMNWMGRAALTEAIGAGLTQNNVTISQEGMNAIARSIINPMFEWHVYAAYLLAVVYIIRMIYTLKRGIAFVSPFSKTALPKEKFQSGMYIIFYALLAIAIVTGFVLKWGAESMKETAEEVHKLAIYWAPAFILLHFTGIAIGELTNKKGITSSMINGQE